jgi:hypothetical protein
MFGSFLWKTQHDAQTMRLAILAKDRAFLGVGLEPGVSLACCGERLGD